MSKPKLDMVEFSFPASDLKDMNENLFVRQMLFDEVTGSVIHDSSYLNLQSMHYGSKPLGIKHIKIDRIRNRVSIIITGKILLGLYAKLINAETIKKALENLIKYGFISFNPDVVIYLSNVHSFDLTKDIPLSMPAEDYLRDLRILGTVHNYRIKNYKSGIDVYSEAQSNKHRMIIYQKYEELCSNNVTNRRLLKYVDKEHFKNTLRIEANFKNEAIIKKYFQIKDDEEIMLPKILNYEENVLSNYFNEMWAELKMKKSLRSVWDEDLSPAELAKKSGMRDIIQVCGYNRENIKCFIKTKLRGKQKTSYYMPDYDNEMAEMKLESFPEETGVKTIEELRNKLKED